MRPWERRLADLAHLLELCHTTYIEPDQRRRNTNKFLPTARIYQHMVSRSSTPYQSSVIAWAAQWSLTLLITGLALIRGGTRVVVLGSNQKGAIWRVSIVLMVSMALVRVAFFSGADRMRALIRRFESESPKKQQLRRILFRLHLAYLPTIFVLGLLMVRHGRFRVPPTSKNVL